MFAPGSLARDVGAIGIRLDDEVGRAIHDRQPVILPPDLWQAWMADTVDEASAVLAAAPEAELVYHPVTKAVGSPKNNRPELVEAIPVEPEPDKLL